MALTDTLSFFLETEEASGNRADSTANALTFTDNNTVTQQTGKVGSCAQFTKANSEYLSRVSETLLQPGPDLSIQVWLYADTLTNNSVFYGIVQKDGGQRTYNLSYEGSNLRFYVFDSGGYQVANQAFSSTGTWTHVIATYDSADKKPRIIVNDGTPVVGSALTVGILTTGTATVEIGKYIGGYWDGRLDQIGMWKRVLSAAEITQLYNSGAGLSFAAMAGSAVFQNSRFARQAVQRAANW